MIPPTPTSQGAGSGGLIRKGCRELLRRAHWVNGDGNVLCLDWVAGCMGGFICQNSLNCGLHVYILLYANYTVVKKNVLKARWKKGRKKKAHQPSQSSVAQVLLNSPLHVSTWMTSSSPQHHLPLPSLQLDRGCAWIWLRLTSQEVRPGAGGGV